MNIPIFVYVVGGGALLVVLIIVVLFVARARSVNLTRTDSSDEKPDWLKFTPPQETMSATLAEGEGITLYNYDEGERLAAPFAEQIEDILHAEMKNSAELSSLKVDLGTNESGELEFWVDGTKYDQIEDIPNSSLQEAIHQAIQKWQQYMDSTKS